MTERPSAHAVEFVDVASMAKWIQKDGVGNIIAGMVDFLEEDFKKWQSFDKIPRVASHTPFGVIELMSAMVAKHLARKDSKKMAMIGTGSQSEFQALGMRAVLGIEDLSVYDVDPHAMEKFRRNLEPLGFRIHLAKDVDEAVEGADIITTCTADKQQAKVLLDRQVKPGVHLNAIGGDCPGKTELESEILDRSTVFVEFPPQTRIEGEIQQKDPDFPVVEFWKVLTGEEPGRVSDEQITLFDSVGFAIADFSGLRYARAATQDTDLQQFIDLVASPDDPKDLYSLVNVNVPVG